MNKPTLPDYFGKRGATSAIIDLHDVDPRRRHGPRLEELERVADGLQAEIAAPAPPAPPKRDPTDVEYVANSIDHLRHLDLKKIVHEMFGETMPTTIAEVMDKMAEWAVSTRHPRAAS